MSTLKNALVKAIKDCAYSPEEEGGIIFEKDGEYKFVYLENDLAGTPAAAALISFKGDFGKAIAAMDAGWKSFASFHIHPSFSPRYSNIDYTKLFQGFKTNYIYSNMSGELAKYEWKGDSLLTKYTLTIKELRKEENV